MQAWLASLRPQRRRRNFIGNQCKKTLSPRRNIDRRLSNHVVLIDAKLQALRALFLAAAFFGATFLAAAFFGAALRAGAEAGALRATVFAAARPRVVLSETPSAVAFCRVAPSVRFSALAIAEAGSLRAIDFIIFTSSDDHGRREGGVLGALATSSPL